MKKLIILFFALITCNAVCAQSCLPEGIYFYTQAQIDNFQTNYPGCTKIEGDVKIIGYSITNLKGLSALISIGGGLDIIENSALTSLTGLENLKTIDGKLFISNNNRLSSLAALTNLTFINGYLVINYNDALTSLTGLENLTSIGGLGISNNGALTNLTGLDNLISINGFIHIWDNLLLTSLTGLDNLDSIGLELMISRNRTLTNLTGLDNLTSIGGGLIISDNHRLTSLSALTNLTSIGAYLNIYNNSALTSLNGLENLKSIGGSLIINQNSAITSLTGLENIDAGSITELTVINNSSLSTCHLQSVCNYLANLTGSVSIYGNANGCNNPPEVAGYCGIKLPCLPFGNYDFQTQNEIDNFQINYPNCKDLAGNVTIRGSDISNLNGLSALISIRGGLTISDIWSLASLNGLDNLTSIGGSLQIQNNSLLSDLTGLDNLISIRGNLSIGVCEHTRGGIFCFGNPSLMSLTGLDNLKTLGGSFNISGNYILTSLTGLGNLTSVTGGIEIANNIALTNLTALGNIKAGSITEYLIIRGNHLLPNCAVKIICDNLASPIGVIEIFDNAPGCNSFEEVAAVCNAVPVDDFILADEFPIYPNPATNRIYITNNNLQEETIVCIFNMNGALLQQDKFQSQNLIEMDVSAMAKGIYLLQIQTKAGVETKKLVVQ